MRMVNINLKEDMIKQIDSVVSAFGFANRSEFIRNAIQERLGEYRIRQAIKALERSRGILKGKCKQMTEEEFEKAREEAFWELYHELKERPQA